MIKPTSNPEVKRIAQNVSSEVGIVPRHTTLPHLMQTNRELSRVMVVATLSIEYMFYDCGLGVIRSSAKRELKLRLSTEPLVSKQIEVRRYLAS